MTKTLAKSKNKVPKKQSAPERDKTLFAMAGLNPSNPFGVTSLSALASVVGRPWSEFLRYVGAAQHVARASPELLAPMVAINARILANKPEWIRTPPELPALSGFIEAVTPYLESNLRYQRLNLTPSPARTRRTISVMLGRDSTRAASSRTERSSGRAKIDCVQFMRMFFDRGSEAERCEFVDCWLDQVICETHAREPSTRVGDHPDEQAILFLLRKGWRETDAALRAPMAKRSRSKKRKPNLEIAIEK